MVRDIQPSKPGSHPDRRPGVFGFENRSTGGPDERESLQWASTKVLRPPPVLQQTSPTLLVEEKCLLE